MNDLYRKLYATLAGRIDTAITCLEDMIDQRTFDWARTIQVKELLQTALLEAEDIYVSAEDEPPPKLIVLEGKDQA